MIFRFGPDEFLQALYLGTRFSCLKTGFALTSRSQLTYLLPLLPGCLCSLLQTLYLGTVSSLGRTPVVLMAGTALGAEVQKHLLSQHHCVNSSQLLAVGRTVNHKHEYITTINFKHCSIVKYKTVTRTRTQFLTCHSDGPCTDLCGYATQCSWIASQCSFIETSAAVSFPCCETLLFLTPGNCQRLQR